MLRVKEILKKKRVTAKELAGNLGISEGALSQQIKEGSNPSLQTLEKIALALGVPLSALFEAPREGVVCCPKCGAELRLSAAIEE